jgi:hypothetical protein
LTVSDPSARVSQTQAGVRPTLSDPPLRQANGTECLAGSVSAQYRPHRPIAHSECSVVTGTWRGIWRIKAEPFSSLFSPALIAFFDSLLHNSTPLSHLDYDDVHQDFLRPLFRRSRSRCRSPDGSATSDKWDISRRYVLFASTVRHKVDQTDEGPGSVANVIANVEAPVDVNA